MAEPAFETSVSEAMALTNAIAVARADPREVPHEEDYRFWSAVENSLTPRAVSS
jgi:hypothetical protein